MKGTALLLLPAALYTLILGLLSERRAAHVKERALLLLPAALYTPYLVYSVIGEQHM